MDKRDLIHSIEGAEAFLSDDIQQLSYISEEFIKDKDQKIIDIPFIRNSIEILLKSMCFNQNELQKTIKKYYEEVKKDEQPISANK